MTGTALPEIRDFHDVVKLLETHPEWRSDLRRLILTDELLSLPQEMTHLAIQVGRLADQMTTLTGVIQRVGVDVGRLKGDGLEVRYGLRGVPLVTRVVRRPHTLSIEELDTLLADAETQGLLSAEESEEITLTDLVISGKRRSTGAPVYVLTEISWGVGIDDVQRAATRASLLAKTGKPVIPAVAGEWVTPEAEQLAPSLEYGSLLQHV